jgi:hypothetical protein
LGEWTCQPSPSTVQACGLVTYKASIDNSKAKTRKNPEGYRAWQETKV